MPTKKKRTKFIFVVGGVMSGVGKGVTVASLGRVLKSYGFDVTALKIDPYLNVDAGTLNPIEHGEVFVTEDGLEADQDLGNYERFLDTNMYRENYMTNGLVYQTVINKERNLEYGGKTVEVIPHIPEEVIRRFDVLAKKSKADFVIVEIGGTLGEYQNLIFLEAARTVKIHRPNDTLFVLVSYLPVPSNLGEMKTKPTQYAARTLNRAGIQADFIVARGMKPLDTARKRKISAVTNILDHKDIISAPNVPSIYEIPLNFERDDFGKRVLKKVGLRVRKTNGAKWRALVAKKKKLEKKVKIGIIGKYFTSGDFSLTDAYLSVIEAVKHAAVTYNRKAEITWIDSTMYERHPDKLKDLKKFDGIIIPGGFGTRGIEGKVKAVEYARKHNIPFLGLCYGLQIAVIEYARNVLKLQDANSTEMKPNCLNPVVHTMDEQKEKIAKKDLGGTMRLGAYDCKLKPGSLAKKLYGQEMISERHRHRWEVNNRYVEQLHKKGMNITGLNPQKNLVEIIELPKHKFFMGTQFHPELKSRPLKPHPLFKGFIAAAIK